jgi:hypothetical protein
MLCPIMSGPDVVCHGCIDLATVAAILLRQQHDRVQTRSHAASFWRLGKERSRRRRPRWQFRLRVDHEQHGRDQEKQHGQKKEKRIACHGAE